MSEHNELPVDNPSKPNKGASRRDFIGKAVISAPVLAAFVSKPSWSIDNSCINSGTLSGNLSNHGCQALARNWQWWQEQTNLHLWNNGQIPGVSPQTDFRDIFNLRPLARLDSNDNYYKDNMLNADGSVERLLTVGGGSSIKQILQGKTKNDPARRAADVDKAVIAAYLNIVHPGIAYSGYSNVSDLIADYQLTVSNYMAIPNNLTFDTLYDKLEGVAGYNNNADA